MRCETADREPVRCFRLWEALSRSAEPTGGSAEPGAGPLSALSREPSRERSKYFRFSFALSFSRAMVLMFGKQNENGQRKGETMTTTHEFDAWADLEAQWACNDPMQEAMDHEFNARYDRWDGYGDIDYAAEQEYDDSRACAADYRFDDANGGNASVDRGENNVRSDLAGLAGKTEYSDEDLPF